MAKFNTFRLIAGIVGTALVTASTLYTQYCLRKQAENDAINAAYIRSRQLDLMRATAKAFAEAEPKDDGPTDFTREVDELLSKASETIDLDDIPDYADPDDLPPFSEMVKGTKFESL